MVKAPRARPAAASARAVDSDPSPEPSPDPGSSSGSGSGSGRERVPTSRTAAAGSAVDRVATAAAVATAVLCVLGTAAGFWFDALTGTKLRPPPLAFQAWGSSVPGAALALAGAILATRLPRHAMTWLLVAGGAVTCSNGVNAAYASVSLVHHHGTLPLTEAATYLGGRSGPAINLLPPLILLFFPDGRLPSRRWRVPAALSLAATALAMLIALTVPWRIFSAGDPDYGRPFDYGDVSLDPTTIPLPDSTWSALMTLMLPCIAFSLFIPIAAFVRRFFGADPERRAQLRWMLLAGMLNVALMAVPLIAQTWINDLFFACGLIALAAAVLIAVSRYRLYDVDLLLGWTLLYGVLAAIVIGVDITVFVSAGLLIDEPLAAVAGAGAVAVLYGPLRLRVQRWVNRLLTGRGEPYDVVSALARRLEDSVGPGELLVEVADTVSAAFRSPYVRVELERADGHTVVAEHGTVRDDVVVLPFAYRGVPIGRLTLVPRRGARLSDTDQRLLADVVRQAAAAARSTALTEELQRSREALVTSVAEERRRLRRDLHDGLGPSLAAVALKVEAARNLAPRDPAAADSTLVNVRSDLAAVLTDVRRLVHDLRPPALDQFGLVGAIRQQAQGFATGALVVTLDADDPLPALPAALEVAAYRIVCEALNNVSRHSGARSCRIRLAAPAAGDMLEVEVADDGRGLRPGSLVGVGLVGMRERAEELGGRCTVTPGVAGGTLVRAEIPRLPGGGTARTHKAAGTPGAPGTARSKPSGQSGRPMEPAALSGTGAEGAG